MLLFMSPCSYHDSASFSNICVYMWFCLIMTVMIVSHFHTRCGHQKGSIFLGGGGVASNLRAQKPNKAQTNQANITGVHYFCGIWSHERINRVSTLSHHVSYIFLLTRNLQ